MFRRPTPGTAPIASRAKRRSSPFAAEVLEDRVLLAAQTPSIDGSNHNLAHPDWGSAGSDLLRVAAAEYADGIAALAGADRPSPREISNELVAQGEVDVINDRGLSALIYVWGQFLDHDMSLTLTNGVEPLSAAVPQGDPEFDPLGTGTKTIATTRSAYNPETGTTTPRQQTNVLTAWLDGSMIYGSDEETAASLRTFSGGRMATSEGNLLPVDENGFYLAGDIRANENPELTSLHTLFVREHNRWADRLARQNPAWTDEQIFQRARLIVIGELQSITYNEWLPAMLGQRALDRYTGYDQNVNPAIANEFSAAAFRLGHSLLGDDIEFLDDNGLPVAEEISLRDAFGNPSVIAENNIDSVLKYLASDPASELDNKIVDGVRNFLFGNPGQGGLDLATLNILRGRDHGLADYNSVREAYGLPRVTSFAQITSDSEVQAKLEELYGSVDDIDLWVGALAEDHVRGASVGLTLRAIVSDQFERLRDGDRFWYERAFSGSMLRQIRSTTLSDVIERNTTNSNIQDDAFFFQSSIAGTVVAASSSRGRSSNGAANREVELIDASTNEVVATTATNRLGRFEFDVENGVRTGRYQVRVSGADGATSGIVAVTRGGQDVRVTLRLQRTGRSLTPLAETQDPSASRVLSAQSLRAGNQQDAEPVASLDSTNSASITRSASASTNAASPKDSLSDDAETANDDRASASPTLNDVFRDGELSRLFELLG